MSAASPRPTAGVRLVVTRAEQDDARIVYRGFAHLPGADLPIAVTVALPGGATHATVEGGSADLEKSAAALVRAATRAELAAGLPLPRKIVRWRG
ncbi:MAG: hypothetical protein U0359_19605 [Byssovorax sp.]